MRTWRSCRTALTILGLIGLISFFAPASFAANCSSPNGIEGAIVFNSDEGILQYCNGTNWQALGAFSASGGAPTGCPNIGDPCSDGSYYIGQVGGNDIYATSSGYETNTTWNNGTSNWTVTGFTSTTEGPGNTAGLVALGDAGSPYDAAVYCDGLSGVHGHSDWYLPAKDELNLFWNGGTPVAGVLTGTYYWSSSEQGSVNAWLQRFSGGLQDIIDKNNGGAVRCVRRRPLPTDPCDPANSPSPGQLCDDGSYYIGQVGGNDIYATTAANEDSSKPWNNGNGSNYVTTGATSTTDGPGNTEILTEHPGGGACQDGDPCDSDTTSGVQPHQAAVYCAGLSNVHGHSDWYLPAQSEEALFWNGGAPIAGVDTSGSFYWSSTEKLQSDSWNQRYSDGAGAGSSKYINRHVRCIRKGYVPTCTSPAAPEGTILYNADSKVPQYCAAGTWIALAEPHSGGSFLPSDVADLVMWMDPDQNITLNGSDVSQWDQRAGSASESLVSNASGIRPTYTGMTINGQQALDFDIVNDTMWSSSTRTTNLGTGDFYTAFVVEPDDATNVNLWDLSDFSTTFYLSVQLDGTGNPRISIGSGSSWEHDFASLSLSPGTAYVMEVWRDGTSIRVRLNGTMDSDSITDASSMANTGGVQMGEAVDSGAFYDGRFGDVLLYTSLPSASEREQIMSYLAAKYGISVSGSGSSCSNPAAREGTILYNDDYNIHQYCDGTNWIRFDLARP